MPVLEDGDFRLTESSAILKYLADKTRSPAYPADLRQRARINERMDWFNTGFYRDFSYGFVYPQIFPFMRGPTTRCRPARSPGARRRRWAGSRSWTTDLIGPRNEYLVRRRRSRSPTIWASMMVLGGEAIDCNFARTRTSAAGSAT